MELCPAEVFKVSNAHTVLDFIEEISKTPFMGAKLGRAFSVMKKMFIHDKGFNVLTLAGAMTAGKMSHVIIEMVERGWVQAVVSTGALMAHGLVEGQNMHHYHAPQGVSDSEFAAQKLNRIYTVLEPETNFQATSEMLFQHIFPKFQEREVSPSGITEATGEYLAENFSSHQSIFGSCYNHGVTVYIPAWTDSELAIEKFAFDLMCARERKESFQVSEEDDHVRYTHLIDSILEHEKLGIFTIGGGVPRNWAQQVGPTLEVLEYTLGKEDLFRTSGLRGNKMFYYGVRITTATPEDAGLSGCLYEEGKSWRKFHPNAETAELYPCDATLYWPLLVTALAQYEDSLKK